MQSCYVINLSQRTTLFNGTVVLFLQAICNQTNIINHKVRWESPVGLGAKDEVNCRIDARPVFNGNLQGYPVTAGELGVVRSDVVLPVGFVQMYDTLLWKIG